MDSTRGWWCPQKVQHHLHWIVEARVIHENAYSKGTGNGREGSRRRSPREENQEVIVRSQAEVDAVDLLKDKWSVGLPGGSAGKESTCNAGDLGSIPGSGRSPGGRHGNPL